MTTIRNHVDGYIPFALDWDIMNQADQGIGIIEGCVCSASGSDMLVSFTAGRLRTSAGEVVVTASSVTFSGLQHATYYKKGIVYCDATDQTIKACVGVAEITVPSDLTGRFSRKPEPPDFSGSFDLAAGDVILCEVWLRPTGNYIQAGDVTDRRVGIEEPHVSGSGASFVIFKSGSTYYSRNGTTGVIEFSGSAYKTVLDSTIAALPSGNSSIMDETGAVARVPTTYHFKAKKLKLIDSLHKVDYRSSSHELSDVGPTNPLINNGYYNGPGNTMCRAFNGDLLYFNRKGTAHVSESVIELWRSQDQGLTWTATTILTISAKDPRNYGAGTTPTGRIILLYAIYYPGSGTWDEGEYIYSDDNGYTWSERIVLDNPVLNGITPGHGSVNYSPGEVMDTIKAIGDGKIAFTYDCWDTYPGGTSQIRLCWSDDDGMSWNHVLIGQVSTATLWCESSFAYCGGKKLVCMCRAQSGYPEMFTSTDNGLTWADRGSTTLSGYITAGACMPRLFELVEPGRRKRWVVGTFSRSITGGGQMWLAHAESLIVNGVTAWDKATRLQFNLGVGGTIVNEYQTAWFDGNKGIVIADVEVNANVEKINAYIVHPFDDWTVFDTPFNDAGYEVGLEGTSANPISGRIYGVNCPMLMLCTGGTGVSIKVTDNIAGTIFFDGLATLNPPVYLTPTMTIGITYSGVPTVKVMPVHSGNYE